VVLAYFRTSRKVYVLRFSESTDDGTYDYSESQGKKHISLVENWNV